MSRCSHCATHLNSFDEESWGCCWECLDDPGEGEYGEPVVFLPVRVTVLPPPLDWDWNSLHVHLRA